MTVHMQVLSEQTLLAASTHHRTIIGDDVEPIAARLHQIFIINGPNNRCGARDQIVRLSEGAFAHGKYHRRIERAAITGSEGSWEQGADEFRLLRLQNGATASTPNFVH